MKQIGYLGPKGTFSYEACLRYSKNKLKMIEYKTITDTISGILNKEIDLAIVPIENSIQGGVTDSIDTLIQNENIKVIDEVILDITQNLLCNKNCSYSDIEVVYSHQQAISQSRKFLEENNLYNKIEVVNSTAEAAKMASMSKKVAGCICSIACKDEYNLEVLNESIQENQYNKTRFWVLSEKEEYKDNAKKISFIFSVKDKPGALLKVLEIFNKYELNLTKIESRPAKTILGEYYFLIDVENENNMEKVVIEELKKCNIYIRLLGKY